MEHYCQLRQMSTRYQAMSQTLPCLYASEMWYRFDGYLQILSSIILFVNPNPFHYAEQIDRCALLGIKQLRHLCLSHLSYARSRYDYGCSSHSIYYSSCIPQLGVQLITSSVGFVAPSSLHSQLYHTWFYLSSVKLHLFNVFSIVSLSSLSILQQYIYTISIPIAIPAVNEPRQANAITMNYLHPKYVP